MYDADAKDKACYYLNANANKAYIYIINYSGFDITN